MRDQWTTPAAVQAARQASATSVLEMGLPLARANEGVGPRCHVHGEVTLELVHHEARDGDGARTGRVLRILHHAPAALDDRAVLVSDVADLDRLAPDMDHSAQRVHVAPLEAERLTRPERGEAGEEDEHPQPRRHGVRQRGHR